MFKPHTPPYLIALFAILLASSSLLAQQLPQINYQGVARKADGSIISDQSIRLRLTILDGGANGASVYAETRQKTTGKFGLFTVVIGSAGATVQTGAMATINWATGNKFLQVELDPLGGTNFIDMGASQLQSVPYAIYANAAAPTGTAGGDLSGNYPNPSISKLNGAAISITAPLTGQVLKWDGSAWTPANELASSTGPQGIPGVAGAAGAKGDIGATGVAGTNGTTGVKGDIGLTGAAGSNGTNGAAGLTTSVNGVTQVNGAITLNKTDIGLGNVNNTTDLLKPVSTATQIALDLKASIATLSAKADQSAVDLKAPIASPIFTGTVSGVTAAMVGLGNVDNTSDANKPVSTAASTALGLKVDKVTGERLINAIEITKLGNQSGINTGDQDLGGLATNTALALKAPIASPTFTGTVSGVTAAMVSLGNVNNTSDAAKPISTETQTALNAKQASLSGTGFVKIVGSTISYDNSTYYLANNPSGYTSNTGTVTSVAALTLGTTGTDLSSSVATGTTTPVITFNVPTASAANRGVLSSTDWSAFNGKQAAGSYATLTGSETLTNKSISGGQITSAVANATLASTVTTNANLAGDVTSLGSNATTVVKINGTSLSELATGILKNTTATGVPSIAVAADFPTLNQNTTGDATNVTGIVAIANGGTGSSTASAARTALGGTTIGQSIFTLANPSAVTFPRYNADNTVSALDAATFRTAIGAGTSSASGTVTSVAALTLGTTGTDLSSTVATGTTTPVITLNVPTASAANRGVLSSTDWSAFNGKQPSGSYATLTGSETLTNKSISGGQITSAVANATLASTVTTNANLTGDVTSSSSNATTVVKINGTSLSELATGILKNTTATGVPSIAIAADFPTLNQNTTGTAAGFTTARTISITGDVTYTSPSFDGTGNVTAAATLAASGATAGTYTKVTVDTKGRVTTGSTIGSSDVTTALGYTPSLVREVADEFSATTAQTSFTLTQTKSGNSTVKMYINGVRISKTAYSVSGTTLTYTAASNGAYALVASDRIQFDYYY